MHGRNWFRERRQLSAAGGTFDEVKFGPIRENRHYHVTRWGVEDETTAPSGSIRTYVEGHGYNHLLNEQQSPAVDTLYWDTNQTFLSMGEALVARFNGAAALDSLNLYVEGWWIDLDALEVSSA